MTIEQNISIIGGSGFVGTRLSNRLSLKKRNYKIFDKNNVNKNPSIFPMDVEDRSSLESLDGTNILINLAAVHRDDVKPISKYDDVNVQGARNICDAAEKYGINKIIFTSSVAVYGFAPANTDESGDFNYFNDYGRTKYMAEKVFKEWQAKCPEHRCLVIVRPTVIFGEGNRGNVYNLLKQIASGRFIMFGDGRNKKSMAYIENVAAFLEYSMSYEPGLHIYNYIDKPDFDMNSLISEARKTLFNKNNVGIRLPAFLGIVIGYFADFIAKITGKNLPVSTVRVKKFLGTTQFASSVSKTNFVPPVTLEEGLARTLRYEFLEDNSDKQVFETE